MISSPPIHAAQIVIEVLSDETLRKEWFHETKLMSDRIKDMRTPLHDSKSDIFRNTIEENIGTSGIETRLVAYHISNWYSTLDGGEFTM
jgi:aspartate/tyrosine/aromatic aminotransferase